MKRVQLNKYIYLLSLLCLTLLMSCSDNENDIQADMKMAESDDIVFVSENGIEPVSNIESIIEKNPNAYIFEDPNSELWISEEEGSLKSASTVTTSALTVQGYDVKAYISSYNTVFASGYKCDSRIQSWVSYLAQKYQYKKAIQIPTGATLILPPASVIEGMSPMANEPGTYDKGYKGVLISSGSAYDTYYLVTEDVEIVYNTMGQQVFPLNNPVYLPCSMQTPNELTFKYQYSQIEW